MAQSIRPPSAQRPVHAQNELLTTDAPTAARFYGRLFGWRFQPLTLANGDVYLGVQHGGPIGGIVQIGGTVPRPRRRAKSRRKATAAVPPPASHWALFVTVPRLKSMVQRAEKLGARVLEAYCPVPAVGAFARLLDPTGAIFYLWQNAPRRRQRRA